MIATMLMMGGGCAPLPPSTFSPSAPAAARFDDSDLASMVPAAAEVMMLVDVAQLRGSHWTRAAVQGRSADERARHTQMRGFDEIADVDRLLVARLGAADDGPSLSIAHGRFDRERLEQAFRAGGTLRISSHRGRSLLVRGADEAMVLLSDRTLVSGPTAVVRGAVDCAFGRARALRDEAWWADLRAALIEGRGRSARPPAFEVGVRVGDAMRARLREEIGEGEVLERVAARVDLGEALDLAVVGVTTGRRESQALVARLRDLVRTLRGRPSVVNLGLAPLLERMRLDAHGARVIAQLHLTDNQREEIAARLASVAEALRPAVAAPSPP